MDISQLVTLVHQLDSKVRDLEGRVKELERQSEVQNNYRIEEAERQDRRESTTRGLGL